MTSSDEQPHVCDWSGTAAMSLLGHLTPDEEASFNAHVEAGCVACQQELAEARSTLAAADLAQAMDQPASVPAELRATVLERMRQDPPVESTTHSAWQRKSQKDNPAAVDGLHTRAHDEGEWEPTNVEGVRTRTLRVDGSQRRVTMMVEMDPGTSYPAHRHAAAEECFVIDGDIRVGNRVLRKGDYQYADAGSVHGSQSTEGGCTLLIVSSQEDVLV